ncbi:MAG TPA: hypothetical protein DHV85_22070 [Candidatus Accumulibacter sp.]|nr:hypothetical protein [Accumulibacter sp.]
MQLLVAACLVGNRQQVLPAVSKSRSSGQTQNAGGNSVLLRIAPRLHDQCWKAISQELPCADLQDS